MTNAELIAELRGHIREVPLTLLRDAAAALKAADKRIADLEAQLPKDGEWIELDKIKTYCSNCNWASYSMLVQKDAFLLRNNKTKYCPNCGAKMKTVTDCHALEESER